MGSIHKLLEELSSAKKSMAVQVEKMNEIINMSNGIMLHLADMLKSHGPVETMKMICCRKETVQALKNILLRMQNIAEYVSANRSSTAPLLCMSNQKQHLEFVYMSVRKLLAMFKLVDYVSQKIMRGEELFEEDSSF